MRELKDIPTLEGKYAATRDGRIWSYKNKKFLRPGGEDNNYQIVDIQGKSLYVHRLVAMAWIPNPDNLPEVNHKDSHRDNNYVDNLEWCTRQYNLMHRDKIGRIKTPVRCIELDKEYDSIYSAAKAVGAAQPNLSTHLKWGTPKTVGGYHWEYIEQNIV